MIPASKYSLAQLFHKLQRREVLEREVLDLHRCHIMKAHIGERFTGRVSAIVGGGMFVTLDEPFARLDAGLRGRMREFVFGTLRQRGIPALLVTHDAGDIADPGRVTQLTA